MDTPKYRDDGKVVLAFLFVLIAVVVFALAMMPIHGDICHETKSGQEQCAPYNIVPVALWHIKEALSSVSDVITAIATALLVFVTWRLVKLGGDQSRTTRAELRAYVKIDTDKDRPISIIVGDKISARMIVVNVGQTPANQVTSRFDIILCPFPLDETKLIHTGFEGVDSHVTIFPDQTFTSNVLTEKPLSHQEFLKLRNDPAYRICLFGRVLYIDVFGGKHETKLRMVSELAAPNGTGAFVYCETGNEAT